MKKRVVAKAKKRRRRNREKAPHRVLSNKLKRIGVEFTAEQLRQRAIKRAKEANDEPDKNG